MANRTRSTVEELTGLAALGEDAARVAGDAGESDGAAQIGARLAAARRDMGMTGTLAVHAPLQEAAVDALADQKRVLLVAVVAGLVFATEVA